MHIGIDVYRRGEGAVGSEQGEVDGRGMQAAKEKGKN